MLDMGDNRVYITAKTKKIGTQIDAGASTAFCKRGKLRIGEIAFYRAQCCAVRMTGVDGFFRRLQHIPESVFGQM